MASVAKLPSCEVLQQLVLVDKLTNKQVGDRYGVTQEAVRQRLVKCGIKRPGQEDRPNHSHYLPWRVRADHVSDILARRLRAYSKRQQGRSLTETESRLLDQWIEFMDGGNARGLKLSVHYDRTDPQGFWLEPRRSGDRDYISPPD